jgi:hypothetical protein
MTVKEAKKAMDEMMAQGTTEDEMLGILYLMFQDDKLSFEELEALVEVLGYEITEEFRNMSPEDQKTKGYEYEDEPAEGVSEEEVEDAKTTEGDGNDNEGGEQKPQGGNEGDGEDNNEGGNEGGDEGDNEKAPDGGNEPKEDSEEELDKARKLYGFDK